MSTMVIRPPRRNPDSGMGGGFKASLKGNVKAGAGIGLAMLASQVVGSFAFGFLVGTPAIPATATTPATAATSGPLSSILPAPGTTFGNILQAAVGPGAVYVGAHFLLKRSKYGVPIQRAAIALLTLKVGGVLAAQSNVASLQNLGALDARGLTFAQGARIANAAQQRRQLEVNTLGAFDARRASVMVAQGLQ